jgi:serine/threonine protein phosphatase PrpC
MSPRPELSDEFCPHGMIRGLPCEACEHEKRMEKRNAEQRLEMVEGERKSGEFIYDWQLKKGEKRENPDEMGQDMFLVDEKRKLAAVFDGMGGEGDPESGARASALAAELLPELYDKAQEFVKTKATREDVDEILKDQIRIPENHPEYAALMEQGKKDFFALPKEAQIAMLSLHHSIKELNPAIKESGGKTTITAGVTVELPDGGALEVIGQVGDSGAVKVREDGSAADLVPEDSTVDILVMMGEITPEQAKDPNFVYGGKKIEEWSRLTTQALGTPKAPMPRIVVRRLEPGESIYYMSDGLRDDIFNEKGDLDLERIGKIVHESKSPKEACAALNNEASKGEKGDDKIVVAKVRQRLEEIPSEELIEEPEEEVEEISPEEIEEVA